jgi:hypothetical protein
VKKANLRKLRDAKPRVLASFDVLSIDPRSPGYHKIWERSVMKKVLTIILGIFLATGLAVAEPPEGKGNNREEKPGPIQVLANQQPIGSFLQSKNIPLGSLSFAALSSAGYRFEVIAHTPTTNFKDPGDIASLTLWYESPDCTGPAYIRTQSGVAEDTHFSVEQGFVFWVVNNTEDLGNYYVPAGSQPTIRSFQSSRPGCSLNLAANRESVEAFPNDPTITGVPNESFTAPITLGQ